MPRRRRLLLILFPLALAFAALNFYTSFVYVRTSPKTAASKASDFVITAGGGLLPRRGKFDALNLPPLEQKSQGGNADFERIIGGENSIFESVRESAFLPSPYDAEEEDIGSKSAIRQGNIDYISGINQDSSPDSPTEGRDGAGRRGFVPFEGDFPGLRNPWAESLGRSEEDAEKDPLQDAESSSQTVGKCTFRQFLNHTAYSKPEIIGEFVKFRHCTTGHLQDWPDRLVHASAGQMGELKLTTDFGFDINIKGPRDDVPPKCRLGDPPPVMLYFVFSTPERFDLRQTVRSTWGGRRLQEKRKGHQVIFFLPGPDSTEAADAAEAKLMDEVRTHGDIVRSQISRDDPQFDTKQITAMLAWVYKHCELARFVFKTTDKTFVNTKRMQLLVNQEYHSANRLYGNLLKRMKPNRNPEQPHFVKREDWPYDYFPPFLKGPSFVISGDVAPRLLVSMKDTPPLPLEMVYVTGLLPLTSYIMRIGVADFFVDEVPDYDNECSYASHGAIENVDSSEMMQVIHDQVSELQDVRNVTCTTSNKCLAKMDGKCMIYAPKDKADKAAKDRGQKRTPVPKMKNKVPR